MRLITSDDFRDIFIKGKQRGIQFLLTKMNLNKLARTKSTFNQKDIPDSNWWIIPKVIARWNEKICGNPDCSYEEYVVRKYLNQSNNLTMLSLGSGSCSHEIIFAGNKQFKQIICVDIAENRLKEGEKRALDSGRNNMTFVCSDIDNFSFGEQSFDIILFHSSLHHFKNIRALLRDKIKPALKDNGLLIINEYVGPNRLQLPHKQIKEINKAIQIIPRKYRKRFKTNMYKDSFAGSGLLRMIIADPSECIESREILPVIHSLYQVIEEKPYGGNILMNVLKDISHNFIENTPEKENILNALFAFEDAFLDHHPSDYYFGVYTKR